MILVAGATGYLGHETCRRLRAAGRPVRALVRRTSDPATRAALESAGVDLVYGDVRDRASLDAACADVIAATDHAGQLALVDAAGAAGVGRFVYVSYSGGIGGDDPLTVAKRAVERRLAAGRAAYTILRPSYFMEAWLSPALGFDHENARATIYGAGERPISWISLQDVAEIAVRVLDDPAAAGATLELGGPEALSPREVVRIFEEETGRRFDLQFVPETALAAQRDAATDSLQQAFAALMLAYAAGDPIPTEPVLRRYAVRLTAVRDYARRAAAAYPAPPAAAVGRDGAP
jgi:NADH dehydrogenase